jgi:hypothetical protein
VLRWDGHEEAIFCPNDKIAVDCELLYTILDSITLSACTFDSIHRRLSASFARVNFNKSVSEAFISKVIFSVIIA